MVNARIGNPVPRNTNIATRSDKIEKIRCKTAAGVKGAMVLSLDTDGMTVRACAVNVQPVGVAEFRQEHFGPATEPGWDVAYPTGTWIDVIVQGNAFVRGDVTQIRDDKQAGTKMWNTDTGLAGEDPVTNAFPIGRSRDRRLGNTGTNYLGMDYAADGAWLEIEVDLMDHVKDT